MGKFIKKLFVYLLTLCILLSVPISVSAKSKSAVVKKTIYTNQTVRLEVPSVSSKVAKTLKWKTSNRKVVRVTQKGKITGVKKGTATITAVSKKNKSIKLSYKVTVKEFEEKALNVKVTKTGNHFGYLDTLMNKKYVVITSQKELDSFLKEMNLEYNKKDYSGKFKKTNIYKKLSKYNKNFFKKKTLCLLENALPSSMQNVEEEDFLCIQKKSGKVYGQLRLTYLNTSDAMTADMFYETYFIELKKSDAEVLQGYEIKVVK